MLIILSQKIDSESSYSDELFHVYHYPSRYRNQIHEGDMFIYYQGNRLKREDRYYFGAGTIGTIRTENDEDYYAELINCTRFVNKVPIYLSDDEYVEQLGYETVRNSPVPPWQSSIRPVSQKAFDYIMEKGGVAFLPSQEDSVDELKEQLKDAIRSYYRDNNEKAIDDIILLASEIRDKSCKGNCIEAPVRQIDRKGPEAKDSTIVQRGERAVVLDANANLQFRTIFEAINYIVGTEYSGWMKACWPDAYGAEYTNYRIWFPKLSKIVRGKYTSVFNCVNTISENGNEITFDYLGKPWDPDTPQYRGLDLIFAKEPDNGPYVFRGVFVYDENKSDIAHNHCVSRRIATKAEVIGSPSYFLRVDEPLATE